MMIDLTETTTGAIHQALRQARQRLGGLARGMVLTLVIVTDEAAQYDAVRAASQAAREHPCRVLAVITRRPKADSRLDAEIRVGETSPGETMLLRMYGPLGQHADSVVAPLLVPDIPVVTWWPGDAAGRPGRQTRSARSPSAGSPTRRGRRAAARVPGRAGRAATSPATPTWAGPGRPRGGRCSPPRWTSRTARSPAGRSRPRRATRART